MIDIHVTDAENVDPVKLCIIARALLELAGEKPGTVTETTTKSVGALSLTTSVTKPAERIQTIAAVDNPAVGAADPNDAATIFGNTDELDAAAIFGGTVSAVPVPGAQVPNVPPTLLASEAGAVASASASNTSLVPVELDSNGLPWDGRIHASTKTTTAAGAWKKKKNVDDATVTAVESELRRVLGLTGEPVNPLANFKTAAELGLVTAAPNVAVPIPTPPAPSPVPVAVTGTTAAPANVPASTGAPAITLAQLLPAVTAAEAAGTLTRARVVEVLAELGFSNLPSVAIRPDLIPKVYEKLFPGA